MMTKNWQVLGLAIFVFLLFVVVVSGYSRFIVDTPEAQRVSANKALAEPSVVTGDIDELADALLQEAANELIIFEEESEDAALMEIDSQAISDFGQSYDEF